MRASSQAKRPASSAATNTSMLPPHDRPTSWARRVEAWNFSREERCPSRQSSATWAMAPSMQPPDTDPAMRPSAVTAMQAPGTRGDEPQVLVTWAKATPSLAASQRRTSSRISRVFSSSYVEFVSTLRPTACGR